MNIIWNHYFQNHSRAPFIYNESTEKNVTTTYNGWILKVRLSGLNNRYVFTHITMMARATEKSLLLL